MDMTQKRFPTMLCERSKYCDDAEGKGALACLTACIHGVGLRSR